MISKKTIMTIISELNYDFSCDEARADKIMQMFEQELATLKKQANCGYDHAHGVTCKKCGWEYNA